MYAKTLFMQLDELTPHLLIYYADHANLSQLTQEILIDVISKEIYEPFS